VFTLAVNGLVSFFDVVETKNLLGKTAQTPNCGLSQLGAEKASGEVQCNLLVTIAFLFSPLGSSGASANLKAKRVSCLL
jgi:hypothetical protein